MNANQLSINYAKLRALHAMFMFMKTAEQTEFAVQLMVPGAQQFQLQLSSKVLMPIITEHFTKLDAEITADGVDLEEFFAQLNEEVEKSLAASRQNGG